MSHTITPVSVVSICIVVTTLIASTVYGRGTPFNTAVRRCRDGSVSGRAVTPAQNGGGRSALRRSIGSVPNGTIQRFARWGRGGPHSSHASARQPKTQFLDRAQNQSTGVDEPTELTNCWQPARLIIEHCLETHRAAQAARLPIGSALGTAEALIISSDAGSGGGSLHVAPCHR